MPQSSCDAPSSVTRFLDLGIAPYLLRSSLLGIVAQRLMRTLCPHCKAPATIDADLWQALSTPARLPRPERVYEARGCEECRQTGYLGRAAVYEMLIMSDALREAITASADIAAIRRIALKEGMVPLRVSGALKVREGVTTPQEMLSVVREH